MHANLPCIHPSSAHVWQHEGYLQGLPRCQVQASIEDTDEPENVMTDAALDFSPGPSVSAPVSPTSAAPDPHNEESDEGNKNKRKTLDADPQGLVADINTSLSDQVSAVASTDRLQGSQPDICAVGIRVYHVGFKVCLYYSVAHWSYAC